MKQFLSQRILLVLVGVVLFGSFLVGGEVKADVCLFDDSTMSPKEQCYEYSKIKGFMIDVRYAGGPMVRGGVTFSGSLDTISNDLLCKFPCTVPGRDNCMNNVNYLTCDAYNVALAAEKAAADKLAAAAKLAADAKLAAAEAEKRKVTFSPELKTGIGKLNQFPNTTPQQLIGRALQLGMGFLGTVTMVLFIYGGVLWMFSNGNSERQSKGLQTLVWGALGVVVILASYAVVTFIFDAFK